MTAGELGIPQGSALIPSEMAQVRHGEAQQAAEVWKAGLKIFNFPDMGLPAIPFETLIEAVLPLVRKLSPDALFSFNPENQPNIDHLDHTITGMLAKQIGAGLNVAHYHPQSPAQANRPELYLWTTHTEKTEEKIYQRPLPKKIRQQRYDYLKTIHPSQFQVSDQLGWIPIFEDLSREKGKKHSERYIKIR